MEYTRWFAKRFCALRLPFPEDIYWQENGVNIEGITDTNIVSILRETYNFLYNISDIMNNCKTEEIKVVFDSLVLLWYLFSVGEIKTTSTPFLLFEKKKLMACKFNKGFPKNPTLSFSFLKGFGVNADFFKLTEMQKDKREDNISVDNHTTFRFCDYGCIYFEDIRLLFGLWIFVNKTLQKPWYSVGKIKKSVDWKYKDSITAFCRIDFRIFKAEEPFNIKYEECFNGLDETFQSYAAAIKLFFNKYGKIRIHNSIYGCIFSKTDVILGKSRIICSIQSGKIAKGIEVKVNINEKETDNLMRKITLLSPGFINQYFHDKNCTCKYCVNIDKQVIYKNKIYNLPFRQLSLEMIIDNKDKLTDFLTILGNKIPVEKGNTSTKLNINAVNINIKSAV